MMTYVRRSPDNKGWEVVHFDLELGMLAARMHYKKDADACRDTVRDSGLFNAPVVFRPLDEKEAF